MNFAISSEEQQFLLADARESIASRLEKRQGRYVRNKGDGKQAGGGTQTSVLQKPCGAFVTLHKGNSLRGCIGRMSATLPLEETVRVMAGEAAFGDPRFPPLSKDELAGCRIEISVLSPMEVCPDPRTVKVGIHGLYLMRNGRSGVLLPQVPVEQGWNLDEYLEYICIKAGLPAGSCFCDDAVLYTFTAVVFGE